MVLTLLLERKGQEIPRNCSDPKKELIGMSLKKYLKQWVHVLDPTALVFTVY